MTLHLLESSVRIVSMTEWHHFSCFQIKTWLKIQFKRINFIDKIQSLMRGFYFHNFTIRANETRNFIFWFDSNSEWQRMYVHLETPTNQLTRTLLISFGFNGFVQSVRINIQNLTMRVRYMDDNGFCFVFWVILNSFRKIEWRIKNWTCRMLIGITIKSVIFYSKVMDFVQKIISKWIFSTDQYKILESIHEINEL